MYNSMYDYIKEKIEKEFDEVFCPSFGQISIPCEFLFSRMTTGHQPSYIICLVALVVIDFIVNIFNVFKVMRNNIQYVLTPIQQTNVTKQFFISISNWNMTSGKDVKLFREKVYKDSVDLIKNIQKYQDISKRSKQEKARISRLRCFWISVTILLLIIGYTIIFITKLKEQEIVNYFLGISFIPQEIKGFVGLFPILVVNLINFVIPEIVIWIVDREKYEFKNWVYNQRTWRIYLLSASNTLLLILFYLQELGDIKVFNFS